MTKKTRAGNKGARRSKPKMLKRVELVRPEGLSPGEEPQIRHVPEDKPFELANASAVIATPEKTEEDQMRILKGSAYTCGATRRATQKALQRKPFAIITPEEFSYVKRDLITIGILSSIMMAAMAVMTFILGID